MRYFVLAVLLFMSFPALTQHAAYAGADHPAGTLIRDIRLEGFVLENKDRFVRIFKPYRGKYLTVEDMDSILEKIKDIYEKEGYKELVSITYKVEKRRLVFTALMTS